MPEDIDGLIQVKAEELLFITPVESEVSDESDEGVQDRKEVLGLSSESNELESSGRKEDRLVFVLKHLLLQIFLFWWRTVFHINDRSDQLKD